MAEKYRQSCLSSDKVLDAGAKGVSVALLMAK
jgi:hypothetical protein